MKTLGMMSIIVATIVAPAIAARAQDPGRGVRRMLLFLLIFNALYLAYLTLVHASVYEPVQ